MKVKELIEELERCDKNADVYFKDGAEVVEVECVFERLFGVELY